MLTRGFLILSSLHFTDEEMRLRIIKHQVSSGART